jgi:hypothetical protein
MAPQRGEHEAEAQAWDEQRGVADCKRWSIERFR